MDAGTAVAFAVALQDHLLAAAPEASTAEQPDAPAPKGRRRKVAKTAGQATAVQVRMFWLMQYCLRYSCCPY